MKCKIRLSGKIELLNLAMSKHLTTGLPLNYCYSGFKRIILEDAVNQDVKLGSEIVCKIKDGGEEYKIWVKRELKSKR
jgi:hypothetical protein